MTTLQSLKSLSVYPTPSATLQDIAEGCGLQPDAELTPEMRNSKEMKRAKARTYAYLVTAPNISQNGLSFSFSAEERKQFKKLAVDLLKEIGDDTSGLKTKYGYVGEDF